MRWISNAICISISNRITTLAATKKIQSIANILRLSEVVCLAATRMYTLAVEHKFTKGRKSMNVVAVCLYVACRQKETRNYMLIDFSDLLQVCETLSLSFSIFFSPFQKKKRSTFSNLAIHTSNSSKPLIYDCLS